MLSYMQPVAETLEISMLMRQSENKTCGKEEVDGVNNTFSKHAERASTIGRGLNAISLSRTVRPLCDL